MKPVVLQGHSRPIRDIKFSKSGDLLFTGSVDRSIHLWNTETGDRIGSFTHNAAISNFCLTKDTRCMISGDSTGTVYLWDVYAGKKIKEFEGDPTLTIRNIDINSTDEKVSFVISGRTKKSKSSVEMYRLFDLLNGFDMESLRKTADFKIDSSENKFVTAKFSDINKKIFTSKEDGSVEIYNYYDDKALISKKIHSDVILDFDLSTRHDIMITAGKDGKLNVINTENLEVVSRFFPEKPTRLLNACKIAPSFNLTETYGSNKCSFIVGGGQESKDVTTTHTSAGGFEVLCYNMSNTEPVGIVSGHFGPVNALGFSGNGRCFASGGEDSTIRLHNFTEETNN